MRFTSPIFLTLLVLLPVLAWMGWPARGRVLRRESISLLLRLVLALCLILSLAGLELVSTGNNLAVVFLVDVSDSMPSQAKAAELDYLKRALHAIGPDDQAAVVVFGADALVDLPMSPGAELGQITSAPVATQTDLAKAIRLGLGLFPSGSARRMVILSDGAQTAGDALSAARFAAASDVQIISVPFVTQTGAEALVSAVDVPSHLHSGQQFDLNVAIQANAQVRSLVQVIAGDQIVYEGSSDLHRGLQTLSLPLTAGAPGFVRYQVQITPEQDTFYQNNRLDAFSKVEGPPRVLVVVPAPGETLPGGGTRPDESSALRQALTAAGIAVSTVPPGLLPADLPTLAQYGSVILVDVPAPELGTDQMDALQSYVRDLGGGLVVIGGPSSYGVGGYYGTSLEAALPVDMQIKDVKRRPTVAIVFIIDRSGSMSEMSGGAEKLELAKAAAARSVGLLFPTDRVGVIAFDDTASWVVPMTALSDPGAVTSAIGTIRPGGGTNILNAVQTMAQVLPGDPAQIKHVILLTDGGADPAGIPELVQKLHSENNITLSTVAIGRDAAPYLSDLAKLGGGLYHFTADAASIPNIFTEETTLATRAYIVEEPFYPKLVSPSPILAGIQDLPALQGYVATSPKDLAQVILESPQHDPILAAWQYGLGRAVAFTSDATGHWASDWIPWQGFPTFWAQAVSYTLGDVQKVSLEMTVTTEGGNAQLTLDALNAAGQFLNDYRIQTSVLAPDGQTQEVTLHQIAPGRYTGDFNPGKEGVYLIHFQGAASDGGGSFSETEGWTMTYSPEYRSIEANPDLMLRLASLTGGKVASANPAEVFRHDLNAARSARPLWPWLIALAALLLPFDVAVRRLILTRYDVARVRDRLLRESIWIKRRTPAGPEEPSPRMKALMQAKGRAHEQLQTAPTQEPNPGPIEASSNREELSQTSIPVQTARSTTDVLLERKKSLRKKRGG